MVVAVVAVEVIISVTPVAVRDAVLARRVLLWVSLGTLISVATQGLRERIRRSEEETARLQDQLRDVAVGAGPNVPASRHLRPYPRKPCVGAMRLGI